MSLLPTIEFTADEHAAQVASADTITRAATALRAQGCVLLHGVFTGEFIETLRQAHLAQYPSFFRAEAPAGAGEVGNRRFINPLELTAPFNTPQLYANPLVLPILRAVLSEELVVGACGTVTSLPGAKEQHVHRDGPPLFNKAVNRLALAHAVDFFVPLVAFNEQTGTTRLFPGTHTNTDLDPANAPFVDPSIPLGSCLLMDYRLYHQGRANTSDLVRPLLYTVYQHAWFKDYKNHPSAPFLKISDAEYAKIPKQHRHLFSWIEHYRGGMY